MKTTTLKITIIAVMLLAAGLGRAEDAGRIVRIFHLGKASAEAGDTINFYGFFPGMSRHDAQFLAERFDLDGNDCIIRTDGEKGVNAIVLRMDAIRQILKKLKMKGQTFEEVGQVVANAVGDLDRFVRRSDGTTSMFERKLVSGTTLELTTEYMRLEGSEGTRKKMPIETAEAREQRIQTEKTVISDLLKDMVDIPVKANGMKPFKIAKYELTQLQWYHVMGKNPSSRMSAQIGSSNSGDCPVESISWNDCQEFFKEFNALPEVKETGLVFRLPTAEEWEYACRAGAKEGICKLSDGTEITKRKIDDVAWIDVSKTKPVGLKKPNAFGLFDMIGNVSEWTYSLDGNRDDDCYIYMGGYYESGWNDESSRKLWRKSDAPKYNNSRRGFRLCASTFKIQPPRKVRKQVHTEMSSGREEMASSRERRTVSRSDAPEFGGPSFGQSPRERAVPKTEDTQAASDTAPEITAVSVESASISDKDKKLKNQVMELCRLPPNFDSAGKWFLLVKEIESAELRQLALKASGAALVYAKKQNIYNSKVKPSIKDASEFEKSFYGICPGCEGRRTISKKCKACGGNGVCRYSNCNNGKHLVHDFGGNHYEDCRDCKGSGECQKCGATGILKTKCLRCNGKGISFSLDTVAEVYHKCVEAISQSYND